MTGVLFALLRPSVAGAQATVSAPAYSAATLHCARFLEASHSEIETETAAGAVQATLDREGLLSLRARDSAGGVVLEGWYDSLALRRRAGGDEISADTDGLIGGRYRGFLGAHGAYVELTRPFVPDEVAELADLSVAMRDLLPPLPARALRPGESWGDASLTLTRLTDTTLAGRLLGHYRLRSRAESDEVVPHGDTVPVPVRQTVEEEGDIYWSPASGLVRRLRHIVIQATVPSGGRVRQPVRSRVEQRVELTRLAPRRPCR